MYRVHLWWLYRKADSWKDEEPRIFRCARYRPWGTFCEDPVRGGFSQVYDENGYVRYSWDGKVFHQWDTCKGENEACLRLCHGWGSDDDEHEPEALIEGDESSKKETEEANPVDNKDYGALKEPEELNLRDNNDDEALKEPEELNPRDNKDDEVSKEQVRKSETIDILSPQEVEVPVQMTDKEILIKYISQRITIPYIAIEMDTTDDKIRRMMKKYDLFKMYYEFHPSEDPFISESRRKKAKKGRIQKGSMTDNDLDCPQLDSPQSHLSPEDEENESKENITAFLTDYLDRLNQRKAAYENLASIIAKESEQEELYHSNGDRRGKRLLDDGDTMGY